MKPKSFLFASFLALLCLGHVGCGYTTHSQITHQYGTVYVVPFENRIDFTQEIAADNKYRIYRPGLETDITRTVTNRFLFDGNLRPVPQEDAALTLKGALVEFRQDPVRFTDDDDILEYRINIVVEITLVDNKSGEQLWREPRFTGDTTYFTSGLQAQSESVAVNSAVADLARRVVERCVEDW